jgi:dipeptidyl aminopeptidase/acylaminoacyl peptidase
VVDAPVQLHHGTADTTVNASASVAIAEALHAADKDVELFLYKGSGHALQGAAYYLYAKRALEFFRAHLTTQ